MLIYQLVFGVDAGQVQCVFHDDARASAGIGPNGEYNCFACGAKAHDELGFIAKYFSVGIERATKIKEALDSNQSYRYIKNPVTDEQRKFLNSIGIIDNVIDKYFFNSGVGKLIFKQTWRDIMVGSTWFNSPSLSAYNAGAAKYQYNTPIIYGNLVPYDNVVKYDTIIICEGEKDMLTAESMGIPNAVAKIGGALAYPLGGLNMINKQVIICYDCDEAGRTNAERDAAMFIDRFDCKVKVIDLGLQDKEDLNDYFIKYSNTLSDFFNLIKNTPLFIPDTTSLTKIDRYINTLTDQELIELDQKLQKKKEILNESKI